MIALAIALAAAPVVEPGAEFAPVQALYTAAQGNDRVGFAASVGHQFGMFVSDDFVIPMEFSDFKQFAAMCKAPAFVGSGEDDKMKGAKAVSVGLACTAPKATAAVARNFDFVVSDGKVLAIRPEGMN